MRTAEQLAKQCLLLIRLCPGKEAPDGTFIPDEDAVVETIAAAIRDAIADAGLCGERRVMIDLPPDLEEPT